VSLRSRIVPNRKATIFKDVLVVVLSNLDQPSGVQKARQFGVMAYFVKASMSINDVVKKVENALTESTAARAAVSN